jgi:effector-binding domain-containing protein
MSKVKGSLLSFLGIGLFLIALANGSTQEQGQTEEVKIKKYEKQAVLYTICRGDHKKIGSTLRDMYFLAEEKAIRILGAPTYVYLNNPKEVSGSHRLTEIRLEVIKESLSHEGQLGEMTDIKEVPAYEAAVAIKMQGVADPATIYDKLYRWIDENEYFPAGVPIENLLIGATNAKYKNIKSEISIPIMKPKTDEEKTNQGTEE